MHHEPALEGGHRRHVHQADAQADQHAEGRQEQRQRRGHQAAGPEAQRQQHDAGECHAADGSPVAQRPGEHPHQVIEQRGEGKDRSGGEPARSEIRLEAGEERAERVGGAEDQCQQDMGRANDVPASENSASVHVPYPWIVVRSHGYGTHIHKSILV
ncbi:hypothetical protein D9M68_754780 [compost metagenome]